MGSVENLTDNAFCYFGDPELKVMCETVKGFNGELNRVAENLSNTLKRKRGLGLAAPQIGITIRLCLVSMREAPEYRKQIPEQLFLVNPRITASSGTEKGEEGCLSLPGLNVMLERPSSVTVVYQDLNGEEHTINADGLPARALQHEIDHLDGILFIDRLSVPERLKIGREVRRMRKIISEMKNKGI